MPKIIKILVTENKIPVCKHRSVCNPWIFVYIRIYSCMCGQLPSLAADEWCVHAWLQAAVAARVCARELVAGLLPLATGRRGWGRSPSPAQRLFGSRCPRGGLCWGMVPRGRDGSWGCSLCGCRHGTVTQTSHPREGGWRMSVCLPQPGNHK